MATLESPIEALALNYGVFTAVNLWPWIAVLTAAISFWKIKKSSIPVDDFVHVSSRLLSRVDSRRNVSSPSNPSASPRCDADLRSNSATTAAATTSSPRTEENKVKVRPVGDDDATIKGKFALYFYNYSLDDEFDGEDREEEEDVERELCGGGEIAGGWEAAVSRSALTVRMGDLGWYRYQDLTVLNGKVVRLWDGELRRRNGAVVTASSW